MPKLLIVDDEDGVRSLVRMTLESQHYDIREAQAAQEALEVARDWQPNLVFLDVMLPDGSGFDVCKQIKHDPQTSSATVVMLTARAQGVDLEEAERCGADDYFTKPFSPVALLRKVEAVLGGSI